MVQEPELSLKRIGASALADIAKHSPELAQAVVDAGAVAYLAPLIVNPDGKLKRQVSPARLESVRRADCQKGRHKQAWRGGVAFTRSVTAYRQTPSALPRVSCVQREGCPVYERRQGEHTRVWVERARQR
jgi:hypothetical protein